MNLEDDPRAELLAARARVRAAALRLRRVRAELRRWRDTCGPGVPGAR